jgi:hypothetical protein
LYVSWTSGLATCSLTRKTTAANPEYAATRVTDRRHTPKAKAMMRTPMIAGAASMSAASAHESTEVGEPSDRSKEPSKPYTP